MKVSAIVLSFNSAGYISQCLSSLVTSKVPENIQFEILVPDNGSSDDSVSLIEKKFPEVTIIENGANLGYAEGNNVGIRMALAHHSDFVWIVNPDVVVREDTLIQLIKGMDKYTDAGILGSKIYFAPGFEFHKDRYKKTDIGKVIWYAGGLIDWKNIIASHRGVDEVDTGQYDEDCDTQFVTGASMFVRSKVYDEVGLIDQKYFLYFEENDFCQRTRARGWRLIYYPDSVVWHANAQATGIGSSLQDYYITRNRLMFGLKYADTMVKFALLREAFRFYFSGRPWQRRAVLDYFTGNLGPGSFQIS